MWRKEDLHFENKVGFSSLASEAISLLCPLLPQSLSPLLSPCPDTKRNADSSLPTLRSSELAALQKFVNHETSATFPPLLRPYCPFVSELPRFYHLQRGDRKESPLPLSRTSEGS